MSVKRWFVMLLSCLLIIFGGIAGLNIVVDPFGIFGGDTLDFHSYDFSNNPRLAKLSWLDTHHSNYDAYIVGASLTSSYPVPLLNQYTGRKFFNVFGYGADMYKTRLIAEYIVKHYAPKELIVNISMVDATVNHVESDRLVDQLYYKTSGESAWSFFPKYLFANPKYATAKVSAMRNDTNLPQSFDVFDVQTGSYDKRAREVEPMTSMAEYWAKNPAFATFAPSHRSVDQIENCVGDIAAIKSLCDQQGVAVTFIFAPIYYPDFAAYGADGVAAFQRRIAQVTDFIDLSFSSLSLDSRYFYDTQHFRNEVGAMVLAYMYQDKTVYQPANEWAHVTKENVEEHVKIFYHEPPSDTHTAQLTVQRIDTSVAPEILQKALADLRMAGYTPVSPQALREFTTSGENLPDKPLLLTFYGDLTVLRDTIYPVLRQTNTPALCMLNTANAGTFDSETLSALSADSSLSFGLYTDEQHDIPQTGVTEKTTLAAFRKQVDTCIQTMGNAAPIAFAFPDNVYSALAAAQLKETGVYLSFLNTAGTNEVVKGLPQTLLGLHFTDDVE